MSQEELFIEQNEERESVLWNKLDEGDDQSREDLILLYRPMVFWLIRKLYVDPQLYPDLLQEGMVALIKAVDKFDTSRGTRFSTYAYYRIRGEMINFLQRGEAKAPVPVEIEEDSVVDPILPDAIDTMIEINENIRKLPARESRIISSILIEGRSIREVADREGYDISHIYRIRRKALSSLRKMLRLSDAIKDI
ncbi:MAG TPA: sigma-70 family RNA polymerase sigma factor [Synergistales bacterium]|nr:sigma-70 family RNA polymerase sigma factor [Synergistales bacterium]